MEVPIKHLDTPRLHEHWAGIILFIELLRFEDTSLLLTKILSSKQGYNLQIDGQAPLQTSLELLIFIQNGEVVHLSSKCTLKLRGLPYLKQPC